MLLAVLLLAQLSAIQHQLWHAGSIARQAQQSAAPHAEQPSQGTANPLCALHDALASMGTALRSAAPVLDLREAIACRLVLVALPAIEFPAPRPASRGPPPLL